MEKKYYFLSGMPRSGNTVLSAILNQNPNIYSSPLSPVCQYLFFLDNYSKNHEGMKRSSDHAGSNNIMKNILNNHYSHINKPIIFDREKYWGTETNLALIKKYLNSSPKIIFTVRPILEILTSFITINKNNYIENAMKNDGWQYNDKISLNDNICDYLMLTNSDLHQSAMIIKEYHKIENKGVYHLVEYDNLISSPNKTMSGIYSFLGIESHIHDFNKILKLEIDDDDKVGMPKDMHEVRPVLQKISQKPEDVLSKYVIDRYQGLDFWKEEND